ncbi:MAG: hypothetical protein ACKORE_02170 [Bacteroidota bacterium]
MKRTILPTLFYSAGTSLSRAWYESDFTSYLELMDVERSLFEM